jgi:hypothetical protein
MAIQGVLEPKLPTEEAYLDVDVSDLFDSDVTIATVTVSALRHSGDDDDTDLCQGRPPVTQGMEISQRVEGGNAGTNYLVKLTVTGSDTSVQVVEYVLPVVAIRLEPTT